MLVFTLMVIQYPLTHTISQFDSCSLQHKQIKVIAEPKFWNTMETKYSDMCSWKLCNQYSFMHQQYIYLIHRWKYSSQEANKRYSWSTSITLAVIILKCTGGKYFGVMRSRAIYELAYWLLTSMRQKFSWEKMPRSLFIFFLFWKPD